MPPAPIDGSCAAVADRDELCAGSLDDLGETVKARCVRHASLVEIDRRVLIDSQRPCSTRAMSASMVNVLSASAGLSRPRRSRRRTRHRDTERLMAGELLGARGGVDHDALAGAGRPDRTAPRSGPVMTCSA